MGLIAAARLLGLPHLHGVQEVHKVVKVVEEEDDEEGGGGGGGGEGGGGGGGGGRPLAHP